MPTAASASARRAKRVSRIAKEGRKYGVFLGLVTQRPAQLDPTLISQCSTVFAMRMANADDQRIVHAAVSDPANRLLGFLASLGTREALAFGAGVPVATRLRFKELPDEYIPKSEAVWGGRIDSGATVDKKLVASVVARWRGLATSNKPVREAGPAQERPFFPLAGAPGRRRAAIAEAHQVARVERSETRGSPSIRRSRISLRFIQATARSLKPRGQLQYLSPAQRSWHTAAQ